MISTGINYDKFEKNWDISNKLPLQNITSK